MIVKNENRKLSRDTARRIIRKIKMDDNMKSLINRISTEKKNKNFDKIKELEIEFVIIKYANNPNNLQSALKI